MSSKVAREVAEAEFERWAEAMGLSRKLDPAKLDDNDRKSLAQQKNLLLDAIEDGNLVVNESGEFVFTPVKGDQGPLTFPEPDGAMLKAVDQAKQGEAVARDHKLLGAITKTSAARFASMKARDLAVCTAVMVLFLG